MNIRTMKGLMATTALIAVVGVASAANAATTSVATSSTVSTATTGTAGTDGTPGSAGDAAINLGAGSLTVIIDANLTGGAGGAGTAGAANNGGAGGEGFSADTQITNTVTFNSGKTITGGAGGNGAVGGGSAGGNGAVGGAGILLNGATNTITSSATVVGGLGGTGGAGNGGNNNGGTAAAGGAGIQATAATATITVSAGSVTGGAGGVGGLAAGTGTNQAGANGGAGILLGSTAGVLAISGSGVTVTGGAGGNAAAGGNANAGTGGAGIDVDGSTTSITIGSGVSVVGGAGGTANGTGTTAQGIALDIDAAVTTITNAGTIGSTTSTGNAVSIEGNITVGTLNNSGTIRTTTGTALDIDGGDTLTTLTNSGTIAVTTGVGIQLDGTLTNFTNSGTISATTGQAIVLNVAGASVPDTITNTGGTITSANATSTQGTITYGAVDVVNLGITGGTIENTATGGNAIYLGATAQTGTLTLTDVTVTGDIEAGANAQSVTLAGTTSISGDVDLGGGANVFNLNGTHSFGTGFDLLATAGTVDVTTGTSSAVTFNKAGVAANNVRDLVNGGTLTFNENFESDTLTNNGTLVIAAGKTYTTSGAMNAGGAGNAIKLGISDASTNGFLSIGSNDVDLTLNTLTIVTTDGANFIADGTEFLIGDGTAAATIGAVQAQGSDVADTSYLVDFILYRGDNAAIASAGADNTRVYVEADRNSYSSLGIVGNNANVGNLLESVGTGGSADVDAIQGELMAASTQAALENVLEQISPTVDGGAVASAVNANVSAGNLALDRLTSLRGAGAAADSLPSRVWVQAFGRTADQDTRDGVAGYDADTYGVAVGGDGKVLDGQATLGAALSYGNTEADSKNAANAESETDSYQLSVYGDYDLGAGTYAEGLLAYAWNDTDTTRTVIGNRVNGDFDANLWNARAEVGHVYDTGSYGLVLVPNVSANYWHYDADSYTETGSGALAIDQDSVSALELGVGVDAKWHIQNQDGSKLEPVVSVGYSYDVIGDEVETTSSFVGAAGSGTFATQGADAEEGTFNIGAGVNFYSNTNWQLTADYDYEVKSDYDAHSGVVRAGYRF